MNKYHKHACACCGFFTIVEMNDICPVCFWQEDFYQEKNIDDAGGPNTISLKLARESFKKTGVMDEKFKIYVRKPNVDEVD